MTSHRSAQAVNDGIAVQRGMIDELEEAIASKEIGRRADTLRRVTDLFVSGAAEFSDEQIALFDEVMGLLVREIEGSARASLGRRLADLPQAPPRIVRALALDDELAVAAPLLAQSERLDEATLIEGANSKSQGHLLAISRRKTLTEPVTDVLVERGDREVAQTTAANPGARFSEFGYSTLVRRCEDDAELALCMWSRAEVPRQHLLKLFAQASETVRLRLEAADRRKAGLVREVIAQASTRIQATTREHSADFAAARERVEALHTAGQLTVAALEGFARDGRFEETAIALSLLCDVPIAPVERALAQEWSEQVLVLAKAIGLTWSVTRSILLLQAGTRMSSTHELGRCREQFDKLKPETARKVMQFYRLREQAAKPPGQPS
jgi:uncharacterized protein (DUF2336 family)